MGRRNEHESTKGIVGSSSLLFYCILSSSLFFHAHLCCSCAFTHFKNVLEEVVVAQEPADVEMEAEMVEETQAAVVEVYLTQQAATDDSSSDDAFDSSSSDDAFDDSSSDDAFDDSSSDNTFDDMANEVQEMQEELAQEEIREQEQEQEREQDAILEQDRIAEEIREQQREQDEEILREFCEQEREEAD